MEFMLWAARSLHIFAVIIWLGSLCFQSAILLPVMNVEKLSNSQLAGHLYRRFLPFQWLSLWTIGITGVVLFLFSSDVLFVQFIDGWWSPVYIKILIFIFVIIISFRIKKNSLMYPNTHGNTPGDSKRGAFLTRVNVMLGIAVLLIAVWIRKF